jgi:hypothetical protein
MRGCLMSCVTALTISPPGQTLGPVTETGLCKEMTHSLKEPIENRHVEGVSFPVTKTIYLFRCGDSGLYLQTPAAARSIPNLSSDPLAL